MAHSKSQHQEIDEFFQNQLKIIDQMLDRLVVDLSTRNSNNIILSEILTTIIKTQKKFTESSLNLFSLSMRMCNCEQIKYELHQLNDIFSCLVSQFSPDFWISDEFALINK